jgi:hypothetical protein
MQIDARDHFEAIVVPSIEAYEEAEASLSRAINEDTPYLEKELARYSALRLGGAAALYLHHFADIVANRGLPPLPEFNGNVRAALEHLAQTSRTNFGTSDVELLGDIADATKHSVLTRRLPREVEEAGQVLTIARGFGDGPYGEGKYGGVDEVWVLARSGRRPLSKILRSVQEAWVAAMQG